MRMLSAPTASMLALVMSTSIFALEMIGSLRGAISTLYLLPFLVGSLGQRRSLALTWVAISLALVSASMMGGSQELATSAGLNSAGAVLVIVVAFVCLEIHRDIGTLRDKLVFDLTKMYELLDCAPQVLWYVDGSGAVRYFNHRITELTGRPVSDLLENHAWIETLHPEDQVRFLKQVQDPMEWDIPVRFRTVTGDFRWAMFTRRPVENASGKILGWIGAALDIDGQIHARAEIEELNSSLEHRISERTAELAQSEERLRNLLNHLKVPYTEIDLSEVKARLDAASLAGVADLDTLLKRDADLFRDCLKSIKVVHLNSLLLSMLGFEPQDDWLASRPKGIIEDLSRAMRDQLAAMLDGRHHCTGTTYLVGKYGKRVPVAYSIDAQPDWSSVICTFIDITGKQTAHDRMVAASEEVAKADRAATVSVLSSTLAHELNEPILAIKSDSDVCSRWLSMDPPEIDHARKALQRLLPNAERMSAIVRRTRDHLIKRDRNIEWIVVGDLLAETRALIGRALSIRRANLTIIDESERCAVRVDRVELQQVVINLINNAVEAAREAADTPQVVVRAAVMEKQVVVTVEDNGPGLPVEWTSREFGPYFTTKPGGMGMGLHVCRSIVESSGGKLCAENREEGGAIFRFWLPLS